MRKDWAACSAWKRLTENGAAAEEIAKAHQHYEREKLRSDRAGYLGGDPTYIPVPNVYLPQPPFEVDNTPFSPEAASVVVESALSLLAGLKSPKVYINLR